MVFYVFCPVGCQAARAGRAPAAPAPLLLPSVHPASCPPSGPSCSDC
jgi:hypothetical protein